MKRKTLGITTALVTAAAFASAGTLGANAAPQPVNPLLAKSEALQVAAEQAGTISSALGLSGGERLVPRDVVRDADGTAHIRYDRTLNGLKVVGGDLVVEQKAGKVTGVTKASEATLAGLDTAAPAAKSDATLVVFALDRAPVLAWESVTHSVKADQTPSVLHTFTDARTGQTLLSYDDVHVAEGTGQSTFSGTVTLNTTQSGTVFQLKDPARGNQAVNNLNNGTGTGTLFTDADNRWGNGTYTDKATAGVDAAYGAAQTWDYYKNVHGRNGIKNNGVGALSKVHYGSNYSNAFWTDSCFCMTYGDGAQNRNPLTSLDVAAHEMSHGVTSATAGLVYSGESGGLNEATSDIFGSTTEFYAANSSDVGDYLIGEEINIRGDGTPLRYMDKPSKDGRSLDYWTSSAGNVDVHYSSGIANHFFYLLAEGSGQKTINGVTYNSPTVDNQPVTGIGRAKAEKIWYRALTTKFTSSTRYAAARTGTLAAAADLYGASSPEYAAVNRAWAAVNVK
ncbi:M4 family metallopeptidase [Nocardia sp. NRRL S-836]|uniref:M4 family metallopeptidase n=1 Tax=Nocardia sp. NRRL S-836 TaxID=1519492 RepID=UPI0006AE48C5|nr:M4 family metallopeptidase [Nocardia sp. NRRL S-836]KOV89895.1 peptidase [Nocardia sp. NRRL S-836]